MDELRIRRNKSFAVPRYQGTGKAAKQTGTSQLQRTADRAAATVSETLRQLMTRLNQAARHVRESRQTLQTGEASLAEVEDNLNRMEKLAQEAAEEPSADRAALQTELEQLRGEIDRIVQAGVAAGLFQEGPAGDGPDALVNAIMEALSARQEGVQSFPDWLLLGLSGDVPDRAELLAALGLDSHAGGAQLLAALGRLSLENSSAAGYLAALYLGTVISGGAPSGAPDPAQAAEGLRQLLAAMAEGMSPDQAVELLTGGMFTSLADFESQFTAGTAPGLDTFLMDLLLSGSSMPSLPSLLDLMAESGSGDLDLLMDLMAALGGSENRLSEQLAQAETPEGAEAISPQPESLELETVYAAGRDLSGVRFHSESNELSITGTEDLVLRGRGPEQAPEQGQGQGQGQAQAQVPEQGLEPPAIRLTGSGTVTLQQVNTPLLTAESAQARLLSAGENVLDRIQLGEGTVLTLSGSGLLHVGALQSEASSVLRLTGGAVELSQEESGALAASIVVDGPASLLAAAGITVYNAQREPLEPFDILWKALLPEWSAITSLAVDGRQGQLSLKDGQLDLLRLWLLKENASQGYPAHTIVLHGRDRAGHLRTRYAYVRWNQRESAFEEISMYPNPFTVTGGEQDRDWYYEEAGHTLCILSGQAAVIAGGTGVDANQRSFSGRIALADGIGAVELTLNGVACSVSEGRAFSLGRGNDVTLLLQRGTENIFESGTGCAGISLGEGTSLQIDQTKRVKGVPDGSLTAAGGAGGAGIGRDSGDGQERAGSILIRGGAVTATGAGGGAGIGGALGAPVGDIRIQGGAVTALAACCAAAIGAGIQGACGDIVITGSARVIKAQGGGPDGDIGGCLFGNCGKVQVSAGTDIGGARLWTQQGLSLQTGESVVTLPRFRVSSQALRLDGLDLSTRETARAAMAVLAADRRWVTRLQEVYGAMYGQLEQNLSGLYSVHHYMNVVRDADDAGALLLDMREILRQSPFAAFLSPQEIEEVGQLLR